MKPKDLIVDNLYYFNEQFSSMQGVYRYLKFYNNHPLNGFLFLKISPITQKRPEAILFNETELLLVKNITDEQKLELL